MMSYFLFSALATADDRIVEVNIEDGKALADAFSGLVTSSSIFNPNNGAVIQMLTNYSSDNQELNIECLADFYRTAAPTTSCTLRFDLSRSNKKMPVLISDQSSSLVIALFVNPDEATQIYRNLHFAPLVSSEKVKGIPKVQILCTPTTVNDSTARSCRLEAVAD